MSDDTRPTDELAHDSIGFIDGRFWAERASVVDPQLLPGSETTSA